MYYSTVIAGGDEPRPDGGVRAGINPAPTDAPHGGIDCDTADAVLIVTPSHRGIDDDTVGAGFIPALHPQNISKIWARENGLPCGG